MSPRSAQTRPFRGRQDGVALLTVVVILAMIFPLGALAVLESRVASLAAQARRARARSFAAAEAGLAHAVAELPSAVDPAALLDGPDGIAGSQDDGEFPFRYPPAALDGLAYRVTVSSGAPDRLRLTSVGFADGRMGTAVAESLALGEPASPAAVVIEGASVDVIAAPALALVGEGERPAIAFIDPNAAAHPDEPLAIRELAARLAVRRDVHRRGDLAGAALLGSDAAPLLVAAEASTISAPLHGVGILLVHGDLRIESELHYRGLVIVLGTVQCGDAAVLDLEGALWLAMPSAATVQLGATGAIRLSGAVLRRISAGLGQPLPRPVRRLGWQELS